jgi:exonuclease III
MNSRAGAVEVNCTPITFSIQNCNSLNLTGSINNFDTKLAAIVQSQADFIFLSDTRVISSKGVSSSQRISNSLRDCRTRQYIPYFNSSGNSRGVAILIGTNIEYRIVNEYRDPNENFFIIDIELNKVRYGIGAVYGPNNTSRDFFRGLRQSIHDLATKGVNNIILGGDWNTTVDRSPVAFNIDTFCMAGLPNPKNSELLQTLCVDFELVDPYRVLYPTRKDYTYLPFGNARVNRSHIDFFIVSASLVSKISDCVIKDSVSCKLFDHKQVFLKIGSKQIQKGGPNRLSNSFLNEKLLQYSVELAARRAHLYSIDCERDGGAQRNLFTVEMDKVRGAILNIKGLGNAMERRAMMGDTIEMDLDIAAKEQDIKLRIEDMIPLDVLEQAPKNCNENTFFVALTTEIRLAGAKTQKFLGRLTTISENTISKKLELLKVNFDLNYKQISELENKLKLDRDIRLREKLKDYKIFETLNAEKASPLLLDLAKKSSSLDSLTNIRDDQGGDFASDAERDDYIVEYYSNLYKIDGNVAGSIEDFLGPEVCNHPTVLGSKLTDFERRELDNPLEITELDEALKKANLRSAPGIDGYSYRFISKFWNVFRYPLFRCAIHGLEMNNLPDFFKTAVIKLIPKKGDTSKIKNWRPISLLSNFYKIISRMINNRLQSICNRVLSRAQKGFTKSRQIQEVIINCMETMDFCKKQKIKGVLASIDQTKAFDSVSHSYMLKVYDFFGFGNQMISWLTAIGTSRTACISLSDNSLSNEFPLEKGHAQGDSPSPLLYNLAAQIQIFRIELGQGIDRISRFPPVAEDNIVVNDLLRRGEKEEGQRANQY